MTVNKLSELEKGKLEKLATENEFFSSLYKQWNEKGELSDKQYYYIESECRKELDAIKNNKKLDEF